MYLQISNLSGDEAAVESAIQVAELFCCQALLFSSDVNTEKFPKKTADTC